MAERFKATVLKTVDRKVRGFESYSLRKLQRLPTSPHRIPEPGHAPGVVMRIEGVITCRPLDDGEVAERLKAAVC